MSGGIGSILGILTLLGAVMFVAGIASVVVGASQGRSPRGGIGLAIIGAIIGILFWVVGNGLLFVNVTQVAVITNTLTGQLETPRRPGTSVIIPGLQTAVFYPTNQLDYTMSATAFEGQVSGDDAVDATTVDGQSVALDVTIFYSINPEPEAINRFHTRWGQNWENFIRSTGRTVVRDIVATFRAEAIYGQGRVQMQSQINELMRSELEREGFILNSVDVRGLNFSPSFVEAVEAAAAAEQRAVQARQEAERARTIAAGERDAAIARAEGEAQSIILRATAEAEALRLVSEQIAGNPALIQYEYVRNLSDNISIALVPSNSPFLFDFNNLGGALGMPEETTVTPGS
jgi:regulator of protease activity HflC (stomatin/prohibitin superfamily)